MHKSIDWWHCLHIETQTKEWEEETKEKNHPEEGLTLVVVVSSGTNEWPQPSLCITLPMNYFARQTSTPHTRITFKHKIDGNQQWRQRDEDKSNLCIHQKSYNTQSAKGVFFFFLQPNLWNYCLCHSHEYLCVIVCVWQFSMHIFGSSLLFVDYSRKFSLVFVRFSHEIWFFFK